MARPAQDSGDGWTIDKPVDSLGRTPTPGQKYLRGKTVKRITAGSIKRPQLCTVRGKKQKKKKKKGGKGEGNQKE